MIYAVILHFDAPLQSWGIDSRFQHRSAGAAPSKSAVCGMVCAACGVAKGSEEERNVIDRFVQLHMDCFCIKTDGIMADFHTVQHFRRATGSLATDDAIVTHRHYWQGSRYNVVLSSADKDFLIRIHGALQNPVWGIWFGRKCCIPAAPIIQEPVMEYAEAKIKAADNYYEAFSEVQDYGSGTDTWYDQPVGFGSPHSSGREGRQYAPRRVNRYIPPGSGDQTDFFRF